MASVPRSFGKAAILLTLTATAATANLFGSPVNVEARATSSSSATALPTVTPSGNAFWVGDTRFYVRGVDYQPGGASDATDPLADSSTCERDIPYFQQLGINTVRVYTVDNSANHDTCMNALAAAGIYVALDVNTPLYSINRDDPGESYNPTYLQSVFATMQAFSNYTNTLLFFNGNEVVNNATNTNAAPFVKAVGRDMKAYRVARGLRAIPIGYSAADVTSNRYELAMYFNCGTDDMRSDFFAFNDYSWCDPTTYQGSQWQEKVEEYGNYSLPFFMSEYGCITNTRTFEEVQPLYDESEMTPVYSGGLVYEYSEEGNGYGLVTISGDTVTPNSQFTALASELAANPDPTGLGGAKTASPTPDACPEQTDEWILGEYVESELPAMPTGALTYLKNGAGTGPGLTGDGSQDASGGSTSIATDASASLTVYVSGSATSTSTVTGGAASSRLFASKSFDYLTVGTVVVMAAGSLLGAALL